MNGEICLLLQSVCVYPGKMKLPSLPAAAAAKRRFLLTKMYSEQHKTTFVNSALQDAPLTISLRTYTNTTKPRREKALTETAHKDDVLCLRE